MVLLRPGGTASRSFERAPGDTLHTASNAIGEAVAAELTETAEGRALLNSVPGATDQEAVLIAGHELIWDIADALMTADMLDRPRALDGDADAALDPLLFVRIMD